MFVVCCLCAHAVALFAFAPKAVCDPASPGSEQAETVDSQARGDAEVLRQRYEALGRRIEAEKQRIAQRDPEFNIAVFIREVEQSVKPAFEHARVSAPQRRRLAGRYMHTKIEVGYVNKDLADILEYLRAIENHKAGVAVNAIELDPKDKEKRASFQMQITLVAVTLLPSEPVGKEGVDSADEDDAVADEAVDLETLRRMVDERATELASLAGGNPRPVLDVLRELSEVCHSGELPAEDAEEPAELTADMLPFVEPSDPWALLISSLQMDKGRVEIVGSAADYSSVNKFRRALEESPAFTDVTIRGTRVVEDGRTELKIWLRVEEPPQPE